MSSSMHYCAGLSYGMANCDIQIPHLSNPFLPPQFPIYIMTFTVSAAKIIALDMMSNSRLSPLQSPSHEPVENGCPYWNDYKIADNIKQCKIIRI